MATGHSPSATDVRDRDCELIPNKLNIIKTYIRTTERKDDQRDALLRKAKKTPMESILIVIFKGIKSIIIVIVQIIGKGVQFIAGVLRRRSF